MENLELEGKDILFESKIALVCFKNFPNLSARVVHRYNEYPKLKKQIEQLNKHIDALQELAASKKEISV